MNILRYCLAAAAGLLLALPAFAQNYPTRPVRMIVPFAAGTTTDAVARVFAEGLAKPLGQAVVVENKAGAGGNIGSDLAARSQPDGYTILMGTVGTHAINSSLYRKMPFDAQKDFVPIGFAGYTPTLVVVSANSPIKTLQDLKAAAAKGAGVSFASAGNGTSGHLAAELLKVRLGGTMVHVPYKDGGAALLDVISGQVNFMFYHPAAVMPHIQSGKLRAIGVSSAKRTSAAPEVPAISEQVPGEFDLVAWFMAYAPAATPPAQQAKLRQAFSTALADTHVRARLQVLGVETRAMPATELVAFGPRETTKWSELVKRSGAQVD